MKDSKKSYMKINFRHSLIRVVFFSIREQLGTDYREAKALNERVKYKYAWDTANLPPEDKISDAK